MGRRTDFPVRIIADQAMVFALKILAGAAAGLAAGLLMARSTVCASKQCDIRQRRWPSVIGGGVFGAAAGYWWASRTG
jgi:hypothetical protein